MRSSQVILFLLLIALFNVVLFMVFTTSNVTDLESQPLPVYVRTNDIIILQRDEEKRNEDIPIEPFRVIDDPILLKYLEDHKYEPEHAHVHVHDPEVEQGLNTFVKEKLSDFKDDDFEELVKFKEETTTFPTEKVPTVIFYNRIGKAGSTTFKTWINNFAVNFHYGHSSKFDDEGCDPKLFIETEYPKLVSKTSVQNIIERHIYYVNFTKFGYDQPDYINLMRHPGSRYVSQFHYWRSLKSEFGRSVTRLNYSIEYCLENSVQNVIYGCPMLNYQTAYFCGTDERCTYPMSEEGYLLAKENMIRHYNLVGVLEYLNTTSAVLQKLYPTYFDTTKLLAKVNPENTWLMEQHDAKVNHPEKLRGKKQNYPPPSKELLDFGALMNFYDYKLYQLALEILRSHALKLGFNFVPSERS